jgi:hypothetical protein
MDPARVGLSQRRPQVNYFLFCALLTEPPSFFGGNAMLDGGSICCHDEYEFQQDDLCIFAQTLCSILLRFVRHLNEYVLA